MPLKPISLKGNWQQKPLQNTYFKANIHSYSCDSLSTTTHEDIQSTTENTNFLSPIKKRSENLNTSMVLPDYKPPSVGNTSFKLTQTPSCEIPRKILQPVNTNISTSIKRTKKMGNTQSDVFQSNQTIILNTNEYKIVKKIGSGGYSNVYMGILTKQNSPVNASVANFPLVAIKTRIIFGKRIEKTSKEINTEINLLKQFNNNSHIIQLVDHGRIFNFVLHNSTLAIDVHVVVLEYAFTDLSSIIKEYPKGRVPITSSIHYLYQIVLGLEALHSDNIVHGDIKPANFVMCKERLKLIDFATSRGLDKDSSFHTSVNLVCTPCYVAPEVVSSHRKKSYFVKLSNDIWGLGCVLYEMVSGVRVHTGLNNGKAIINNLKNGIIKVDYSLIRNDKISQIIKRCLELDERKRITITELKREIEQIM